MKLVDLPDELTATFLTFLTPTEVVNCFSLIDSNLNLISKHNLIWKEFSKIYWNYESNQTPLDSYFEIFKNYSKKYPNCLQCYSKINKTWKTISTYLKQKTPKIYESIHEGCSIKVRRYKKTM